MITLVVSLTLLGAPEGAPEGRLEFFEKNVRPILARRCYECHSARSEKLRGNLYLDSRRGWMVGGDSGAAIAPGDPDGSLLIQAVRYVNPDLSMPPKGKLPPAEVATLELWVANGAVDPRTEEGAAPAPGPEIDAALARREWPYTTPRAHSPPEVRDTDWPVDPVDRFVLAKLEEAGLAPAPDADPCTLARRLHFDLTGLPPAPEEVTAFVALWERSPLLAIETTADELLASPRFGEHWGRKWLDLARYADTNGSDFNATYFNAWKYRDYVIAAFNADKPYDRFLREQIAGDLLPAGSDAERAEGIIATGFLMLGAKMLSERDKEKLRMDVVDEQLDTLGKSFLGLSLGCARCHDHKFDPVSTREYYALAGILRSSETLRGEIQKYVSDWVRRELPVPGEHRAALAAYEERSAGLKKEIAELEKRVEAAQKEIAARPVEHLGIVIDDAAAKRVGRWKSSTYTPRYVGVGYIHDEKTGKGEKSVTFSPDIPEAGEYEVRVSYAGGNGRADNVPVTIAHAGGETEVHVNQVRLPEHDKLFHTVGRYRFEKGRDGGVTIATRGTTGYVIVDAAQFIPVTLLEGDGRAVPAEAQPSAAQMRASELYKEQVALERELEELEKSPPPPVPRAMAVAEAETVGDCRVRIRGEPHNRGDLVPRGFLRVSSPDDAAATPERLTGSGRAELARWLTRPDHPLTARVFVNRVWYHLIGEGIVRTVDNFGALGDPPTHAELLDTLAADFVSDGWSVKRLVRRIVLSRVYRMASTPDARGVALDPENRWLWRAHRRRLPAEALRDTMLLLSGELDLRPSRNPVKTFKKLAVNNGTGAWSGNVDPALELKRSVYQPVVRGALSDFMSLFDVADPDTAAGRRPTTTVPTQALFLMNDSFVIDRARKTAAKLPPGAAGVDVAYLSVYGRPPTAGERRRALEYIQSETAAAGSPEAQATAARARFVQALFASTEFRMLD